MKQWLSDYIYWRGYRYDYYRSTGHKSLLTFAEFRRELNG